MSVALTGTSVTSRTTGPLPSHAEYVDRAHGLLLPAWQTKVIVFAPIVCATLLAKFGIPPLANLGIGLLYPIAYVLIAYGFVSGQLQFEPRRLALYMLVLGTLGLVQLLRMDSFSLSSFTMMAALAFTFVFTTRTNAVTNEVALGFFCNLSAIIALLGIAQFVVQFAGIYALTFPIESFVPQVLRTSGYNNISPLFYGSPLYKSTGFVMLEPSVFSQVCAIGLMAELLTRGRLLRLALYSVALIVAYSGTGLLILAITLPVFLIAYRRWTLLGRGLVLLALIVLFAEPLNLTIITNRLNEFGSTGSSGFARFVGWQDLFSDRVWPFPSVTLFGHGAGSFKTLAVGYAAAEMAHTKMFFEFGVIGGLLYFSFIFFCIFANRAPRVLQMAIVVCYFMNGAYSPTMIGLALTLLLWPNSQASAATEDVRGA
jgi:hypothetical protein